jgi:hypothetical protein
MVRTFFTALTIPEQVPFDHHKGVWRPLFAVTTWQFYPRGREPRKTVYGPRLSRYGYRVGRNYSATRLKMGLGEVETETDDREVTAWRMFLLQLLRRWTISYIHRRYATCSTQVMRP